MRPRLTFLSVDHRGVDPSVRVEVKSENTIYTPELITSHYVYEKNHVQVFGDEVFVTPKQHLYTFKTKRRVCVPCASVLCCPVLAVGCAFSRLLQVVPVSETPISRFPRPASDRRDLTAFLVSQSPV